MQDLKKDGRLFATHCFTNPTSGRSQFIRKQQIEFCARYFLCLIRERRYKLNDNEEIALKTLK